MGGNFCEKCGAGIEGQLTACPRCGQPLAKKCTFVGTLLGVLLVCGVLVTGFLAVIFVPGFIMARGQGQRTACCSNMKNIGVGLEMWSRDNNGHYPDTLDQITPHYLRVIPTCPSAGTDSYSSTYTFAESDREKGIPDSYTFYCNGTYHTTVGEEANYPQYTSLEGLRRGSQIFSN